ncbi:RING-H2 finger protein ATL79 [Manihot esculenta]|uniref:RING-type domain-containing protein n=1 Tax=Manihot esculenta TaxID=3983 RepID=A0A2C9ULE9_MANES|nr:RING-H2 finger protein ATL79 [Manihot esculenta]OAY31227.1 hypothetical protein MANES_14G094700v8 [Manihot esculenta]
MLKYLSLISAHFKWALNFLIRNPLFQYHDHLYKPEDQFVDDEEVSTGQYYKCEASCSEAIECAVCLSKIEQGEEMRELRRCKHMFHRVCLDRWVAYGRMTCPLCRDSLAPRRLISELGGQVLVFKFSSFIGSDDRHTWWLR